jgi:hypothetical protein
MRTASGWHEDRKKVSRGSKRWLGVVLLELWFPELSEWSCKGGKDDKRPDKIIFSLLRPCMLRAMPH